ncbi:MAG: hypothetical protein E4H27_04215 [Anaerolineales bacterium]|nr:MAG: hypothetical protein E4H27_04215 [Anaerolineales bacterium]
METLWHGLDFSAIVATLLAGFYILGCGSYFSACNMPSANPILTPAPQQKTRVFEVGSANVKDPE